MSQYAAFRRVAVAQQMAQSQRTINIPAPTRGIIMDENEAFMQPGGAILQDNWFPTLRGCALRGGSKRWIDLHGYPIWTNNTAYALNAKVTDASSGSSWTPATATTG